MLRFTLWVILAIDEDCARHYLQYVSYYVAFWSGNCDCPRVIGIQIKGKMPGYDDLSDDDRDIQMNDFDSEYV